MRLFLIALAIVGTLTAAAYSRGKVVDHLSYANSVSHSFAAGDNGITSGWRGCSEIEDTPPNIGVVCDGRRVIQTQSGQMVDVNYFCEFQFRKESNDSFRVLYSLCQ